MIELGLKSDSKVWLLWFPWHHFWLHWRAFFFPGLWDCVRKQGSHRHSVVKQMILILKVEILEKYFQKFIRSIIFIKESRKGKLRKYDLFSSIKSLWECAKVEKAWGWSWAVGPWHLLFRLLWWSCANVFNHFQKMTSRILHQKGLNFYQVLVSLGDSMGEI